MLIKIILLTIVFEKIQTQGSQFSQFWDSSEESAETKELFSKEFYRKGQDNDRKKAIVNEDVSISISEDDERHYGVYQKQNQPLTLSLRGNNIPKQFPVTKSVSNYMDSNGYTLLQDKFKRQITNQQLEKANYHPVKPLADVSLSMSAQTKEFNSAEVLSNKLKRQIQSQSADFNIQGNNNRFFSLINLPLKLNILANVLSVLNQDVVDTKGGAKDSNGFSINGNNNQVTNLLDLPVDVKAVLNVLSTVNIKSGESKEGTENQQKPLKGLLGVLLEGGSEQANEDLLGGLLGGVTSDGLVGDLLGEDLGLDDLLSTLLGNDAEFGHLLAGVFAKDHSHGLLAPLLENLLEAVGSIVEHLLELLTALLEGILKHSLKQSGSASGATLSHILTQNGKSPLTNSDLNIRGNNNQITSLINAPIKLKAFINVLSSLKQEISKQTQPNAETNSKSEGSSAQPVKANAATLIQGNNNELSNLLNVKPEVDVKLNLLSQITEILNPVQNENDNVTNETNSNSQFDNSDEICFDVPIQKSETSIVGNNNRISQLLNVQPKLNLDLNVLSQLTQTGGSIPKNIPTQKICIPRPTTQAPLTIPTTTAVTPTTTQNNEICFDIPIEQSATSIRGNNNRISQLANVQPKINLDLNLLSKIKQTGGSMPSNIATQRICIPNPNFQTTKTATPTTPTPTTTTPKTSTAMTPPANPNEICFDIPIDQSGTSIIGNNNRVFEAVNVNPNVNLVLNLLSQINQSQNSQTGNVPTQRICIPIPTTPKSSTNKPTATPTAKPTATPTATPFSLPTATPSGRPATTTATTTPLPPSPTPEKRCFKRVCTRWLQTRDYKCLTKQDQFPKYTFTYTY